MILMFRPLVPALALAVTGLLLTGCGGIGTTSDKPQVVASFYPLQYVADRIVGDHADVTNLTHPGAEPHDLELTVRQTAMLSAATVGIYEHGLQPAVDQAMRIDSPRHTFDITSVVSLQPPAGDSSEETADDMDPHFWQDPLLMARVAREFTAIMSEADPAHTAAYRRNDARLQGDLSTLDHDYRVGLRHCRTRTVVVSHDAFEYLGRRYQLRIEPIAGLTPDSEPSARHLAELSALIRSDGITTVFAERLASPKLADALANDLGIRAAVLDPIEGLTSADSNDDYLSLMRDNLAALQKANHCR